MGTLLLANLQPFVYILHAQPKEKDAPHFSMLHPFTIPFAGRKEGRRNFGRTNKPENKELRYRCHDSYKSEVIPTIRGVKMEAGTRHGNGKEEKTDD